MKRRIFLGVLAVLSCFQFANAQTQTTLVINEIMARNIDTMIDPSFNYGGWIELYNPTESSISLNGMYISYDPSNLKMVQLTSSHGSVPAHGFKTLWFDHYSNAGGGWGGGSNEYSNDANKQINFKIMPEGDTLYISDKNGKVIITQICPRAIARTSYARVTDGGDEWGYTYTPTEGKSNVGSIFADEQLEMPRVDHTGTVYNKAFDIHVDIPEGATLRYTTDGSTPTLENGSTSEDGVFNIGGQKNFAYRFRLYKDGYLPSDVATHTYIYNLNNYYLPVVSIVTDSKNLYDDKIGVFVDGTNGISDSGGYRFVHGTDGTSNKNRGWERPVNFELLVPDSASEYCVALNQEVNLQISGGWSRHFPPSPSFKLKANKVYGEKNYFDYPIFSQKPYIKNKAILVRNGGNDCDCRIFDAAIHEIINSSGFYLDCQAYQPSHVFVNGKYQFMFNIRETNNKNFAYANYGIDKDNVDQFEYGGGGYTQKAGDDTKFVEWTTLCNKLSSNPTDENIWGQICELCDIDEICNYFATELYVGSEDWITNNNNTKGFRDRNDGKFHFIFFDVDEGFNRTDLFSRFNANKANQGGGGGGWGGGGWGGGWGGGGGWFDSKSLTDLLSNLLTHQGFRKQFIDTYCILHGSVFASGRSTKIIRAMAAYSEAALAIDGKDPWDSQGIHNLAGNEISGRTLLNKITSTDKRAERIRVMQNFFSLPAGYDVTIKSNLSKAELLLNDVRIPTGKLEGTIFAPAVLTTDAPSGYAFKGWKVEGSVNNTSQIIKEDDTWQYYDQGSLDNQNWQSPSYNTSAWKSGKAPLGYNNSNTTTTKLDWGSDTNNKRPTYYFRKQFNLSKEPDATQTFDFSYSVDDGCIIYVNGTEVHRDNMPEGTVSYTTFSPSTEGQQVTGNFTINSTLLHAGSNVIAVEVHNNNAPSSDLYWAGTLTLTETGAGNLINEGDPQLVLDDILSGNTSHVTITAQYEAISDSDIIANRTETAYAPIRVNEVSAANDIYVNEHYKKNDWIELYNATDMTINVAGLYISDNPNKPQKYQIPTGNPEQQTVIKPGGKLIIWADKLESIDPVFTAMPLNVVRDGIWFSNIHSDFKLGNEDDKEVIITSSDAFIANNPEFCEAHPSFRYFADHLVYKAHKHDQTVGRYPDGGNNLYVMNRPTIGTTNALHTYDVLFGVDDGVIVDDPTAIDAILADNSQISISFSGNDLVIEGTASTAQLNIYTSLGQLQKSQKINIADGPTTISVATLPSGIYVANVKGTNGQASSCKFMIK